MNELICYSSKMNLSVCISGYNDDASSTDAKTSVSAMSVMWWLRMLAFMAEGRVIFSEVRDMKRMRFESNAERRLSGIWR